MLQGIVADDALRRLLGENSFLLFYRQTPEGWKPARFWISAQAQGTERANARVSAPLGAPSASAFPDYAAPSTEESFDTLSQMAMDEQNPVGRLDALTRLGGYAHEDRRAQTLVSHVARNDLGPQIKAAEELLQNLE